jgi:hypothetical protein
MFDVIISAAIAYVIITLLYINNLKLDRENESGHARAIESNQKNIIISAIVSIIVLLIAFNFILPGLLKIAFWVCLVILIIDVVFVIRLKINSNMALKISEDELFSSEDVKEYFSAKKIMKNILLARVVENIYFAFLVYVFWLNSNMYIGSFVINSIKSLLG